jgi:hypothetical protein
MSRTFGKYRVAGAGQKMDRTVLRTFQETGYLSGIALSYGLDDRRFESRRKLGIFLFTTASRPALGSIQPLIR